MNVLILSALLGVIMMFSGIAWKNNATIKTIAVVGAIALLAANWCEMRGCHWFHFNASAFMYFDSFALLFNGIAVLATLIYFLVTAKEMQKVGHNYAEYFALIFFILSGVTLLASFRSLLTLFLGIEIVSIPLYILTGSDKKNLKSNEAALKYFLMGSFSTGILLMGIALIYGAQGTFSVDAMDFVKHIKSPLQIGGILLLLFSMAFKASVAPFHFWTPDVYDGAPTVFTSYMATVVKAAIFIGFIRLFGSAFNALSGVWQLWIAVLVAATLFIGNITAVFQQSVKRVLAYSSISQAGFMLMAVLALNSIAQEGLMIYVTAYCLATIGVFATLAKMKDFSFEGFNGLAKHQPLLALTTTICLLSLAGIPLTAGFLAKFYMLNAVVATGKYLWLVIFAVLMAAISVYYYFRIIQAMYFKEGPAQDIEVSAAERYTMIAICALLILIGVCPALLLNWLYF